MIQKNSRLIAVCFIFVSALMNIVSYFYLPEHLVMQIKFNGEAGTTLPTLWGLFIMSFLLAIFAYKLVKADEIRDKTKWLAVSILILIVNVITIIFNLR